MSKESEHSPKPVSAKGGKTLKAQVIGWLQSHGHSREEAKDIFAGKLNQIIYKYPNATQAERRARVFKAVKLGGIDVGRRAQTRRKHHNKLVHRVEGQQAELHPPDEIVEAEEERKRLWEAIGKLKPPYQQIVVLRWIEGLSTKDVAERLELRDATVRQRCRRVLPKLRRLLH